MSNNCFLEKLLDGVEVEWTPLREVVHIRNGYAFKSSMYCNEGIRVIRISDVQKGKISEKNIKFYPLELYSEIERYLLKANDLVMSLTGNCGRVAMLSNNDLPAALNQRVACLRPKRNIILTRYLFHYFDQISFEDLTAKTLYNNEKLLPILFTKYTKFSIYYRN
ncbi:restriction endonuclease subunit S [Desulfoplanes formicivorans]|uniref:Restriction endonuclease n=1 Tax=Desulfoplanes formicivorans TaxID=1592317 RepID=A0A194AJR5_9BACT|nr:restriction endonuclease subunit S [Desulfoplanes formicivorans]GAU09558.1 restriction endonuclease [Desulfoplanes formicivorans]